MAGDNKVQGCQNPQPPANCFAAEENKLFSPEQLAGKKLGPDAVADEAVISQVDSLLASPEGIQRLLNGWREFKRQLST